MNLAACNNIVKLVPLTQEESFLDKLASSAVDKALDLMEVLARADQPMRLTDLATQVHMHRATAHRVLVDLIRRGWVQRTGDSYLPGIVALQLGDLAVANSLIAICRPTMQNLSDETAMMVNLQVLAANHSRVIDVIRPQRLEMITDLRGELLPVHKFAGTMALVAKLADSERLPYLKIAEAAGQDLDGNSELLADIERTIRAGYAIARGRKEGWIASISRVVQSPTGMPICALTIVGLNAEFDEPHLTLIKNTLYGATSALQERVDAWAEPRFRRVSEAV